MALTAGAQKSVLLYSGLNPQVVEIMEDDGFTSANDFYEGDCVSVESSGQVILAVAADTYVFGVARKASTGTNDTPIPVELLDIHSIYTGRIADDATSSEAYIGDIMDWDFTAGAQFLKIGHTTAETYCVGLHPVDGGKLGGRVLFRWYSTFLKGQF